MLFRYIIMNERHYKKVIKMQKHQVKLKSRVGLGKLARKVLRQFRADVKSSVSSIGQEKFVHAAAPVIIYHDSQREIRSALINAERQKGKALMEEQKHRFI